MLLMSNMVSCFILLAFSMIPGILVWRVIIGGSLCNKLYLQVEEIIWINFVKLNIIFPLHNKQSRIINIFWAPKSLQMVNAAMKLKDTCSLEKSYDQPRQYIKKQRHYFANKGPSDRKSTRLNSSHSGQSRMPSSA